MNFYTRIQTKAAKQLKIVAYFIAFPNWVVVQNISFFILLLFYGTASRHYVRGFAIRGIMSLVATLVFVGATCSVIGAGIKYGHEYFIYSIRLLPNYLYWATTVIFLGNLTLKFINVLDLYRMFLYGLISLIITFFFLDPILKNIPIYNGSSDNSFAFLLILFSPMSVAYIQEKRKNLFYSILFTISITMVGFLSGSRSGSLLALSGCILVLSLSSWVRVAITSFIIAFIAIAVPYIKDNQTVKTTIHSLNERTYNLIYDTESTLTSDQSFLIRLAMIEKGLELFKDNTLTGVGIGNFGKTKVDLEFEFEGGDLISQKEEKLGSGISAHNSYISFLAEGGLLLFIPYVFLMFYPIFYFITRFNSIKSYEKAIFISIIFMCIHSWFISAMLNIFGWFVLGIANSIILYKNDPIKIQPKD